MNKTSLSHQAYQQIKQKIVSLELPPGSVIDEAALKKELGVGRTPIREALQRLALEKLVVIIARRGMFVSDIGITDLQQLFEVRLVLESLAARKAAQRGSPKHWIQMEEALSCSVEENDHPDNELLITIDETCHRIIYEAADNVILQDTLSTMYALSLRLWYFFLSKIGDMRSAVLEHKHMLDAFKAKDGDEAARLMSTHIHTFQDEIQSVMLRNSAD